MALNKEKVQDLIDDFVVSNVDQINEVATESPMVYDAVINALNLLSRKFGTIQAINIPKPAAPKANALNPIIQEGATFIDTKDHETKVEKINFEDEIVTFTRVDNQSPIKLKFSVVNDAIERGNIKLVQKTLLNALIKLDARFKDKNSPNEMNFLISAIDYDKELVEQSDLFGNLINDYTFEKANQLVVNDVWVPVTKTQPQAPKLNSLVDIGEVFEDTNKNGEIITITDIDYNDNTIKYDSSSMGRDWYISFDIANNFIDKKRWVHKPPVTQSNTFGALTLNPSVQVGQKYIDLEDDSNFSVLLIDQKKQVVTINWNEDDIQGEVDFEDFNDNLEAATWVIAPDQAQVTATEDEILDAIEGLELIGDAVSKKEISELKKQLKQLKKKKP